jgi:hypothetical protein
MLSAERHKEASMSLLSDVVSVAVDVVDPEMAVLQEAESLFSSFFNENNSDSNSSLPGDPIIGDGLCPGGSNDTKDVEAAIDLLEASLDLGNSDPLISTLLQQLARDLIPNGEQQPQTNGFGLPADNPYAETVL